ATRQQPSRPWAQDASLRTRCHGSTICLACSLKPGFSTPGLPCQMALNVGFELVGCGLCKYLRMFYLKDIQHVLKQFLWKTCLHVIRRRVPLFRIIPSL